MAVLLQLHEQGIKPKELHLFYAHLKEHSPDTHSFVIAGMRFARANFPNVHTKIIRNSINAFFREKRFIPHPTNSFCTMKLKIEPINKYAFENDIRIDLVGYVKDELKRRIKNQNNQITPDLFGLQKQYPIGKFDDEWCIEMCDKYIGWHPAIYDIKDEKGKRIFSHNNCLPCKNMYPKDIRNIETHFPSYFNEAMDTCREIGKYIGRDENKFYAEFGRELGQDTSCEYCKM